MSSELVIFKECRICFENESINKPVISPCSCNGTSKYIHIDCLRKWIANTENPVAKKKCMECHTDYDIIVESKIEKENLFFLTSKSPQINYLISFFITTPFFFLFFDDSITKIVIFVFYILNFGITNTDINEILDYCTVNCYEVNLMFFLSFVSLFQFFIFLFYFLFVNNFLIKQKDDYNLMIKDIKYKFFMLLLSYFIIYYMSMLTNNFYIYYIYSIIFIILQPLMTYRLSSRHNI